MNGRSAERVCSAAGNIAGLEGLTPAVAIEACAEQVRSVATDDHRGGRGDEAVLIPGEGVVDHEWPFRALLTGDFAGPRGIVRIDGDSEATAMGHALIRARAILERPSPLSSGFQACQIEALSVI